MARLTRQVEPKLRDQIIEAIRVHRVVHIGIIMDRTGLDRKFVMDAMRGEPGVEFISDRDVFRWSGDDTPATDDEVIEALGEEA